MTNRDWTARVSVNRTLLAVLCLFCLTLHAEENSIERLYKANQIKGSILIESEDGGTTYHYNVNSGERFVPASTFKIPNTLIILEEGLIRDASEIIKWDGVKREYPPWNRDQTLATAFQYSCVWCYQRYAKQVGDDKYRTYLNRFNYGNQVTGPEVTRFWLDGDLRISVEEQIRFLRKVYAGELPVQQQHIETLKNIMLSDSQKDYKVWSKTGWSGKDGWFVGYLTSHEQTWFFANHIEINEQSDLEFRKKLTMETFKLLKIID